MNREDRFVMSHRPYAVDLASLRTKRDATTDGHLFYPARVDAVWFRKRRGVVVACVGTLWDYQDQEPASARQFLEQHQDGRYGGSTRGRWDGQGYWGEEQPEKIQQDLDLLRPMLANYPEVPPGYDGWWVFPR